ncbi:MAG TPA: DUF5777 family beta-barrel protein [Chryseosolibacter sp.]|nr:DUF5777 family beta-barrel protein [Chryseosolibacter sp.]
MIQFRIVAALLIFSLPSFAQDDLMKMLETETAWEEAPQLTTATFKTTRIINGHSVENVGSGVLDLRISHRFGYINSGVYELFGLDQATMRLGLDYGLTRRWMIGVGRSTYQKQFDGFTKLKLLQQSDGGAPVTASAVASVMYKSLKFDDPTRENYVTSNLFYSGQLLIGRKMSEGVSLQLMPTMIHYNLVPRSQDPNDIIAVGAGGRVKLSKRLSINAEYYYQLLHYRLPDTRNAFAIGFDIETGGHVFQLNFTNATGMTERSFISETTGNFFEGDIHFGFTISRVFTIVKPPGFSKHSKV